MAQPKHVIYDASIFSVINFLNDVKCVITLEKLKAHCQQKVYIHSFNGNFFLKNEEIILYSWQIDG